MQMELKNELNSDLIHLANDLGKSLVYCPTCLKYAISKPYSHTTKSGAVYLYFVRCKLCGSFYKEVK